MLLKKLIKKEAEKEKNEEAKKNKKLLEKMKKEHEKKVNTKILADVLKIGYPYMKKHLRLFQIVPYLRITASHYYPSYKFEELLSIKKIDFTNFIA